MIRAWSAAFALGCFSLSFLVGLFQRVSPWERLHRGWWALAIGLLLGAVSGWLWQTRVQPGWTEPANPELDEAKSEESP